MKKHSLSWWKKKADTVYSRLIRLRYADKNGYVKCFTCGVKKPWKEMQNGHYIPRNYLSTRFEDANCRPQCFSCNVCKSGNYDEYAYRLVKENGENILQYLNSRKNMAIKYKIYDYQEMIDQWTDELVTLEQKGAENEV